MPFIEITCEGCDNPHDKVTQPLGQYDANSIWLCQRCQHEQREGIEEDIVRLNGNVDAWLKLKVRHAGTQAWRAVRSHFTDPAGPAGKAQWQIVDSIVESVAEAIQLNDEAESAAHNWAEGMCIYSYQVVDTLAAFPAADTITRVEWSEVWDHTYGAGLSESLGLTREWTTARNAAQCAAYAYLRELWLRTFILMRDNDITSDVESVDSRVTVRFGDGQETVDARDLSTERISALRAEAASAGDVDAVETLAAILLDRK